MGIGMIDCDPVEVCERLLCIAVLPVGQVIRREDEWE